MLSLVFLCSRRVVSDHSSLRRALPLVPDELYPVLFRAAFLDKKTLALQDLAQRWPLPVLSLQRLLQSNGRSLQLYQKANRPCVQAVIQGVMAFLREELAAQNEGRPLRKRLRLLDMTGSHDDGLQQGPGSMSVWARTVTLAKSCIDIAKRQSEETVQVPKRRKGAEDAAPSSAAAHSPVYVEVRVDLFVNRTSYRVLREALLLGSHGPLRLQCRDIQAEELSLRSTVTLLELLRPDPIRQIDLCFNNLGLPGLNALLPHMTRFPHLQSLKLLYSNIDVRRLPPTAERDMQNFASHICQLSALKEINLGSSRLSGRIQQLLGGLRSGLESLELAFCYLLPADLHYLSRSIHVSSLKKLDLSGNFLCDVLFQPFVQLLDSASCSLLYLDVMECKLNDSALLALTPALCRCCSLRYLGLFCNPLSGQGVRALLQSFLRLAHLQLVIYPIPVECYPDATVWPDSSNAVLDNVIDHEKAALFQAELREVLARAQRTDTVWTTNLAIHQPPEYLNL